MPIAARPNFDVERLRQALKGQLFTPEDDGYEDAHRLFMPVHDGVRPAAVAQVADAGDIASVLTIAREAGVELAIRSGGHSAAGHSTTDGGIVIDLRSLKSLEIDVESRTAWADSGLTAAEYSHDTNAVGFATGLGDTGSVGLG